VRLHYWLWEVLHWIGNIDNRDRVEEEALALLGEDKESVEAALVNLMIGMHVGWGSQRWRELTRRTIRFIRRLPYSEILRSPYIHVRGLYTDTRNVTEAIKWNRILEEKATAHHDLRALADVRESTALSLRDRGDLRGALAEQRQALALLVRIGDIGGAGWKMNDIVGTVLSLGDLTGAGECARQALEYAEAVGLKTSLERAYRCMGRVSLCRGDLENAVEALCEALSLNLGPSGASAGDTASMNALLGRAYLAQGKHVEALNCAQEAVTGIRWTRWGASVPPRMLAVRLSELEEAYQDAAAFRAFCHRFRQEHPELERSGFGQWYLEPARAVRAVSEATVRDGFTTGLSPEWAWHDPYGDCSYTAQNGLEIRAANGRDLWFLNLSAPRVLRAPRASSGDLVVQATCVPASNDRPAIGGLLLWAGEESYLRLDRDVFGEREITLMGCLGGEDVVIGRGRLYEEVERVTLRLERAGERVEAFCSADGERWFTVGGAAFPAGDPVQVGVHAIGEIDRTIYRGAFPEGTAIRFESFELWGNEDAEVKPSRRPK
jgi:tetratricopeptide (TPR) repeat protein